ncbi:glycosyltransferase 87 family protein [Roseovarius albus]|uniref:glycosyltransferase 87 family protein n=1 Tax=Roseovarius albus TaxID=1247867 RepID=UPI00117BC569|nr:glycosyltransferase 87 family protein [Roseovarius albus]
MPLEDMPLLSFVTLYVGLSAGSAIVLPWLVQATPASKQNRILIFVLFVGVAMRLSQFGTEPILEDDYFRYLWDGAVTANGYSPYQYTPESFLDGTDIPFSAASLSTQAAPVLERINYPELKTIYPPVAQGGFVLAYWISPLDPDAWRILALTTEAVMLAFLILILQQTSRPALWCALYWWHPIAIKEIANSMHMEPLLMLPVVIAGWLILRTRNTLSSVTLAIAAGVKVWPVMLAPVLWRQMLNRPIQLLLAVGSTGLILGLIFWPIVSSGLDQSSGFVAFAQEWRASSAAYLVAEAIASLFTAEYSSQFARFILVLIGAVGMIYLCRFTSRDSQALFKRYVFLLALLYLLLPSQTPWYYLWIAPFLCVFPMKALLVAGALIPLHYTYFFFAAYDLEAFYHYGMVWIIWLPVWASLLMDKIRGLQNFLIKSKRHV